MEGLEAIQGGGHGLVKLYVEDVSQVLFLTQGHPRGPCCSCQAKSDKVPFSYKVISSDSYM